MFIDVDGGRLSYHVAGEGEPLLWVHGFMGAGADWRYLFGEAPAGYRVIAPDLRGHGASADPGGRFTFAQCARDVSALLRHLGLKRVRAIGLSGGGIVLLHLAVREPALLDSMVLISTPPRFPEQARAIQREYSEAMMPPGELALIRGRHVGGDAQIAKLFEHARALADDTDDVSFTPAMLASIQADTLIVFGDRDPLYPLELAVELRDRIPRSYLWVVPNGAHVPVFGERAPAFVDTALAFLSGAWRQSPAAVP